MSLPAQLLLSDLLARRVLSDRGEEFGVGQQAWMHPPVHRLLGWVSRPSPLSPRRCVWRLDQLRGLADGEVVVRGEPADTDPDTLERLPTLLGAALLDGQRQPLARLVDAVLELRSGRILHYLVARSDPRLPGGSRWRLSPDRIVDQRPGEVFTALTGLDDLPLARASLREDLLRRSRRWRQRLDSESSRWRQQWQQASDRFEDRLEGWLEEPPWDDSVSARDPRQERRSVAADVWPDEPEASDRDGLRRRPPDAPPPSPHPEGSGAGLDEAGPLPADQEVPGPLPWRQRADDQAWQADDELRGGPDPGPQGPASARRPLGARPRQRPSPPPDPSPGDDDPWV